MKFFTRERYLALQDSGDSAADAADAAWDEAARQYHQYLESISPSLPESVRELLESHYLHDAQVLSMAMRGDVFVISLRLDTPPNDLLTMTFSLAGSPELSKEAFPGSLGEGEPLWLYEELETGSEAQFVLSVLFSNGWQARVPFREVRLATALPMFPEPRSERAKAV